MFAYLNIHTIVPEERLQFFFSLPLQLYYHQNRRLTKDSVNEQLDCILALNVVPPYWHTGCNGKSKIFHRNCYSPWSQPSCTIRADEFAVLRQTSCYKYRPLDGVPPPTHPTPTGLSMEFKRVKWGKRKWTWPPIRLKNIQKRPNSPLEGFSSKHEAVLDIQ